MLHKVNILQGWLIVGGGGARILESNLLWERLLPLKFEIGPYLVYDVNVCNFNDQLNIRNCSFCYIACASSASCSVAYIEKEERRRKLFPRYLDNRGSYEFKQGWRSPARYRRKQMTKRFGVRSKPSTKYTKLFRQAKWSWPINARNHRQSFSDDGTVYIWLYCNI